MPMSTKQNQEKCRDLLKQLNRTVKELIDANWYVKGLKEWLLEVNSDAISATNSNFFEGWKRHHRDLQRIAEDTLLCWLETFKPSEIPSRFATFVRWALTGMYCCYELQGSTDAKRVNEFANALREVFPKPLSKNLPRALVSKKRSKTAQ